MNNSQVLEENHDANKAIYALFIFCGVLAVVIFLIDLAIPLGVAGGVPHVTVILLSLWLPSDKSTLAVAVLCSCFTLLGFYFSPPGGEMWKVLSNRGLALFAIWVTTFVVIQKKNMEAARENDLKEIKILQGLLSICAACKKIQDDKGIWNPMEVYIKERSEADFSHGICPECCKKLYPEIQ